MSVSQDFLYDLLPAFVRNRDYYQRQPLRALMEVLGGEYRTLDDDLHDLYHDWFIETCDPWVVPYIGELIGMSEAETIRDRFRDLRSLVANSIAYRRRKGIPAVAGRVAQDATGWPTRAVQGARRLVRAQALVRLHPGEGGSAPVRDARTLATLGGPFDAVARTVDVRRQNQRRHQISAAADPAGGFNLPSLALYVWRLAAFPLERVTPCPRQPGAALYRFHPLGVDGPLFNRPRPPAELTTTPSERNLPVELTPAMLAAEIAALRQGQPPPYGLFGARPALAVFVGGRSIPPEAIEIADLGSWSRPAAGSSYRQTTRTGATTQPIEVAVDPARGRLAFPEGRAPEAPVEVSFSYALAAGLGGGPYERASSPATAAAEPWRAWVGGATAAAAGASPASGERVFAELSEALRAWRRAGRPDAYLRLAPGTRHHFGAAKSVIDLWRRGTTEGSRLTLCGAAGGGTVVEGVLRVRGGATGSGLRIENVWLDGRVELERPTTLQLSHATIRPPGAGGRSVSLAVSGGESEASRIEVSSCVLGPVHHHAGLLELTLVDSVVDGGDRRRAITASGGGRLTATFARVTCFGGVELEALEGASDSIFTAPIEVVYPDRGSVRYSYVPPRSRTPRRIRCQPDLALERAPDEEAKALVALRLRPVFTSRRYGDPGYAQLAPSCPREIRIGAESGAEMGVYERLQQPQREAALELAAEDYVPYGMEARVFYVT